MTGAPTSAPTLADAPAVTRRARRPRWVRWVGWVVAFGGAVLLAAGALVALRDASVPTGTATSLMGTDAFHVAYADAPGAALIRYEHGAAVGYAFELANDGPLPVTVEAVPLADVQRERRLLHPTEVLLAPPGVGPDEVGDDVAPFEPFRLGPGERRTVVVSGVFYNCAYYTERAIDLVTHQPVTWSVAGVSTTSTLALTERLAVRSPHIRDCPGRVMDRGARTRTAGGG